MYTTTYGLRYMSEGDPSYWVKVDPEMNFPHRVGLHAATHWNTMDEVTEYLTSLHMFDSARVLPVVFTTTSIDAEA